MPGRHAQVGALPQLLGIGAQWGGTGFGTSTHPPDELPPQYCIHVVPGGHAPPSSTGTHRGCGPQKLFAGWTHTSFGAQLALPHGTTPASDGGGGGHAQPTGRIDHVPFELQT